MMIRMIDWVDHIQPKLLKAGYTRIPNGIIKDGVRKGDYFYYIIEFDTPEDEILFSLRWA